MLLSPAPGTRYYANGTLYYVGSNGFSWSSSGNISSAYYLNFSDSGITPQNTARRACGLPVRCLQE